MPAEASPSFFCIGPPKTATTWLDVHLRRHPQVWLPPLKELHYFDYVHATGDNAWIRKFWRNAAKRRPPQKREWILAMLRAPDRFTDDWYRRIFALCPEGKVTGDMTPSTCGIGPAGIEHVQRVAPDAVFMCIVRDPVERAWSQVKMSLTLNGDDERAVVDGEIVDMDLVLAHASRDVIKQRGAYATFVPQWDATGKVLYLPFAMVRDDPKLLLDHVGRHLGLTEPFVDEALTETRFEGIKVAMPDAVREKLTTIFAEDVAFVRERFADDPLFAVAG